MAAKNGGKVLGANQGPSRARSQEQQVKDLLKDPSLYPDEFKAWLPRWLFNNVNFTITSQQLPKTENAHLIGASGEIAFEHSTVNFGGSNEPANYYKDAFGRVFVGGIVKSFTAVPVTLFTLPSGYRPQYAMIFAVISNGALGVVTINTDGTVVASAGNNTYLSLSGISFRQFA